MIELSDQHLAFLQAQRVGHLATADAQGQPHVIPVCYACDASAIYIALDAKPKRVAPQQLKRVRNILENPQAALVVDRYDEDWSRLAYVFVRGTADLILSPSEEHDHAVALLRARYTQYRTMPIDQQPVIRIRPQRVTAWGDL